MTRALDRERAAAFRAPMGTPWGAADHVEPLPGAPEGVFLVSTPSHGGAFVPDPVAETMPEGLRTVGARGARGWWFEEDCAICAVVLAWPASAIDAEALENARRSVAHWTPSHLDGPGCGRITDSADGFHRCAGRRL